MNFDTTAASPVRRAVGLGLVAGLHLLALYAFVHSLSKPPAAPAPAPAVSTRLVAATVPPPLPPPPPAPKVQPPPPSPPLRKIFQRAPAPAEAHRTAPTVVADAPPALSSIPNPIQAPAPAVAAAPAAAPPAPPATPPAPASTAAAAIGVACPTMVAPVMPARAQDNGISGSVKARATIVRGKVVSVEILSARPRGVFEAAVRSAMLRYGCQDTGDAAVLADQDFQFRADD